MALPHTHLLNSKAKLAIPLYGEQRQNSELDDLSNI